MSDGLWDQWRAFVVPNMGIIEIGMTFFLVIGHRNSFYQDLQALMSLLLVLMPMLMPRPLLIFFFL